MRIRIYYNRRGPLPWSFDYGDQESETNLESIVLDHVYATSHIDAENRDPEKPSAWLEVEAAIVHLTDDGKRALITR